MAITRVHPDMVEGTALIESDKAGADSGGTSGKVVQLDASNEIATGYLDTGTTDGKVVLVGGSDKIATSLIDTGTTDGKIVQMAAGDKLPAVDGSLLTSILQALPVGMPLQIQSTQTDTDFEDALDTVSGDFSQSSVSNLITTLTTIRASSKFRIDVTWSGQLETGSGTTNETVVRDLGFYLVQIVDVGGANTTSKLTGETEDTRHPVIAPVSINSLSTSGAVVADYLINCTFSYIVAPSYTVGQDISYQLAASVIETGTTLHTNRSVTNDNDNENMRSVSSIIVTEIRGA